MSLVPKIQQKRQWGTKEQIDIPLKKDSRYVQQKIETIKGLYNFMAGGEHPSFPSNIYLEVSNVCNCQCLMCNTFSSLSPYRQLSLKEVGRGIMAPVGEHKKTLDDMLKHALYVYCFGYGEPLCHPNFKQFLKDLAEYEVRISFFTNGMNMDDELISLLVSEAIGVVTFSFTCCEKENYESIYNGVEFETVLTNIKKISDEKKRQNSAFPVIEINSLAFNEHIAKLDEFVNLMGKCGVNIIYVKPLNGGPMVPELAVHKSFYRYWEDKLVLDRAHNIADEYGMLLDTHLYEAYPAKSEEHYKLLVEEFCAQCGTSAQKAPRIKLADLKNIKVKQYELPNDSNVLPPVKNCMESDEKVIYSPDVYCLEPFKTAYICLDGSVKPCCGALVRSPLFGNAFDNCATKVWSNGSGRRMKESILYGDYPEMCHECIRMDADLKYLNYVEDIYIYRTWFTSRFNQEFVCTPTEDIGACGSNQQIVARHREKDVIVKENTLKLNATIVHVNDNDLIGSRFNGHDMQIELNKRGTPAKQFVLSKQGDNPNTLLLTNQFEEPFLRNYCKDYERRNSIHGIIYPYGWRLLNRPEFKKADIVHYHLIHNYLMSLTSLPDLVKAKPSVFTLHDPWVFTGHCIYPMDCDKWVTGCTECPHLDHNFPLCKDNSSLLWNIKKEIYESLDADIVVASEWMKRLVEKSPITSHFKRIHLIPFGINTEMFTPKRDKLAARNKLNIPKDDFVIFFRSDQSRYKGLPLIKLMLKKLRPIKPTTLLTCGADDLINEFSGKYKIVQKGWVTDDNLLAEMYCACDVFLMPSYAEAFGLMAIEAMASSRPIIVMEGTSLPDVTFAPECGVSIPKNDDKAFVETVERLMSNPDECLKRGEKGRELAEIYYKFKHYVDKHIGLYANILERNGK